jgi:hypothetical protein
VHVIASALASTSASLVPALGGHLHHWHRHRAGIGIIGTCIRHQASGIIDSGVGADIDSIGTYIRHPAS